MVNTLPRTESNSGMVNIKLKRKMSMKNYHKFGMINPSRMYDCLNYWVKNHPEYKGIKIENEEDWRRKCPSFFNDIETSEQDFQDDDVSSSDDESDSNKASKCLDDNGNILEEPKDCDYNATTCLYPKEPAANVIVNHSN